jgi:Arc/MetJ-type ribon-helix-helix transcriptional regulator
MAKTTIELPDELKRQVEKVAKSERRSQAAIIRDAIEEAMRRKRIRRGPAPKPTIPLTTTRLPRPDMAENFNEYLKGFGSDRS